MPQRSAETRERILRAAAAEILADGYASASLSSIAARLGLTKGALAYHFPSKWDAAEALFAHTSAVYDELRQGVRDDGLRGVRALVAMLARGALRTRTDVVFAAANSLIMTPGHLTFELPPVLIMLIDTYAEYLTEAIEDGEVSADLDVVEAAEEMMVTYIGGMMLFTRHPERQGPRPMRLTRRQLTMMGVADADAIVDEMLACALAVPPRFDEPVRGA
ncbi:TetR/AcrR family transcriptional regulator [Planococcus sp. APC 4015]|nr:TetR/AcrR family transcriptional regulator [Planococcus sp. APC 4015]